MYVVIAGGGRTGAQLSALLIEQEHQVCLVESRPAVLRQLHRTLPTEAILEGDPTDPLVLEHARAQEAQGLAARAAALTRAGRAQLPEPSTPLRTGDILHLSATLEGVQAVQQRLAEGEGA